MTKRAHIMVGDGNPNIGLRMVKTLEDAGYGAFQASDQAAILSLAASQQPELILLGRFPEPGDVLDIAAALKGDPATADIPVMLFDAIKSPETRHAAVSLKLADLVEEGTREDALLLRLSSVLRLSTLMQALKRRAETCNSFGERISLDFSLRDSDMRGRRLLLVSESSEYQADLLTALLREGFDAVIEQSPYRAADRLGDEDFEVVIITATLYDDREKVRYLLAHIRSNPALFRVPSLVVKEEGILPDEKAFYAQGADIVIPHDRDYGAMTAAVAMLLNRRALRERLITPIDGMLSAATADEASADVYSNRFLCQHLDREIAVAEDRQIPLTLVVIGIPTVARIVEEYGKDDADVLTRQAASWITGMVRRSDLVGRLGTASFAILMPFTDLEAAKTAAFRIAGILEKSEFHLSPEVMKAITILVDVIVEPYQPGDTAEALLDRAQEQLISSK